MSRSSTRELDDLVGTIYDAGLGESSWTTVVDQLRSNLDCPLAALFFRDPQVKGSRFELIGTSGYSENALADYNNHHVSVDIRAPYVSRLKGHDVYKDGMHLDFADVAKSEIFNDFFRPADGGHALGANLFAEPQRFCLISAHRSVKGGQFTDEQVDRFRQIIPHVSRALRLHRQVAHLDALSGGLSAALDHCPVAVFLVRRDARIVSFNDAADRLLKLRNGPMQVIGSRLTVTHPGWADVLRDDVRRAVDIGSGGVAAPPTIRGIPRTDGSGTALGLMVAPVRRPESVGAPACEPLALVFVTDAAPYPNSASQALMSQFGLSMAEAEVAAGLLDGLDVYAIADRRGVSRETVRVQLRSIFSKTRTISQAQLVSLASRSLALLRRRPPDP